VTEEPDEARDNPPDESPETPPSASTPPARGGSAAAAARRARRIGGRPAGVPRSEDAARPAGGDRAEPGAESAAEPVSMKKGGRPAVPPGISDAPTQFPPPPTRVPAAGYPAGDLAPEPVVITAVPVWLNWLPAAVLSLGVLAMAIILIVFSNGVWWGKSPTSVPSKLTPPYVREQVLAAAKTCVATTNTYKYTDLQTYETNALACSTGEFTSQLKDTIEKLIMVNAPKLKSSQTAQINRGGIEAISPDGKQWTILLFGQLTVTNNQNKQPRTDPFAAEVRMDRVGGKWLIGGLTTVSTPLS
jgi:hypothetical protein